jgi:hypothetical protein
VVSGAASAACQSGEVLVSAYCSGTWEAYPLAVSGNGASCEAAPGAQVTIACMAQ